MCTCWIYYSTNKHDNSNSIVLDSFKLFKENTTDDSGRSINYSQAKEVLVLC